MTETKIVKEKPKAPWPPQGTNISELTATVAEAVSAKPSEPTLVPTPASKHQKTWAETVAAAVNGLGQRSAVKFPAEKRREAAATARIEMK